MGLLYDSRQPTSYITEVDANNLYGWAMSKIMPDGNCEWLSEKEIRDIGLLLNYGKGRIAIYDTAPFDHLKYTKDKTSFLLEVDLEYPPKLQERNDYYPLASDIMIIRSKIIS